MVEYWKYNDFMCSIINIYILVFCISVFDDLICIKDIILFSFFKIFFNLFLVIIEKGGYCGFLENGLFILWVNKFVCDYFEMVYY